MKLTSSAFKQGDLIPRIHTCDGDDKTGEKDKAPPLQWEDVPKGTVSLALICDDPDAPMGTWDHWVVYNIPTTITQLDSSSFPKEMQGGLNSWKRTDYGGPCPPDREHRYFFRLYALDKTLSFTVPPTKAEVLKSLEGHTLAMAELMGRYDRPRG